MTYRIHLTRQQLQNLKNCGKKRKACRLRIHLNRAPNYSLKFTPAQIASIEQAKRLRKKTYSISLNRIQTGGFLPLIIPALAALGKAAAIGSAGYLGSKLMQKITGKGVRVGKGVHLPGKKTGRGISTRRGIKSRRGKGVRLPGKKTGRGVKTGQGIYLPGRKRVTMG